jgi:hypothetical protein
MLFTRGTAPSLRDRNRIAAKNRNDITHYRRQSNGVGVSISAGPVCDVTAGLLGPHKIDGHYVLSIYPALIGRRLARPLFILTSPVATLHIGSNWCLHCFQGGHNHMVDKLHQLANGQFDGFCFYNISTYQYP